MSGSPLDAGQVERISTVRKSKGWNRVNPRFLHQWDFFSNVENSIICSDAYQRQDLISSKESLVAKGKLVSDQFIVPTTLLITIGSFITTEAKYHFEWEFLSISYTLEIKVKPQTDLFNGELEILIDHTSSSKDICPEDVHLSIFNTDISANCIGLLSWRGLTVLRSTGKLLFTLPSDEDINLETNIYLEAYLSIPSVI